MKRHFIKASFIYGHVLYTGILYTGHVLHTGRNGRYMRQPEYEKFSNWEKLLVVFYTGNVLYTGPNGQYRNFQHTMCPLC